MITIISDALFLTSEKKSFKSGDRQVEYTKATFLNGENELVEATVDKEVLENKDFVFPDARADCEITLEVIEEKNDRGSYLRKRILGIVE